MKATFERDGKTWLSLNYKKYGEEINGEFIITPKTSPKLGKGIEIDFTDMYEAPEFSFSTLMEISNYFGTTEIDFNDSVHNRGCDTCDYGSEYGYRIQVYGITKNYPF